MRATSRVLALSVLATGVAFGWGEAAWAGSGGEGSLERLEALPYPIAVLSQKDARPFTKTTASRAQAQPVAAGAWRPLVCNDALPVEHVVAGRMVQYDPSNEASMANFVVAFDTTKSAKAFVKAAALNAKGCDAPYTTSSGGTFSPVAPPKISAVGDDRSVQKADLKLPNGTEASSLQLFVRKGPFVDSVQMLSVAPITPKIVKPVVAAVDDRLEKLAKSAAKKPPHATRSAANRAKTCEQVLTKTQLEKAFGVGLKEPDDCSYELAQGFGGVDVGFTAAAGGSGWRSFSAVAKGEALELKGARDAFYSASTNSFGQVSSTIYVLTDNGSLVRIGLRGDDVPKNQKPLLIAAAKAALKPQ